MRRFVARHRRAARSQRSAMGIASASDERRFTRIAIVNDVPFLVRFDCGNCCLAGPDDRPAAYPSSLSAGQAMANSTDSRRLGRQIHPRIDDPYRNRPGRCARPAGAEGALKATLADVRASVTLIGPPMREAMRKDSRTDRGQRGAALLDWLQKAGC
ncbi:MAG: hypothetical protein R3D99_01715 [Altererythrobacter sp.]